MKNISYLIILGAVALLGSSCGSLVRQGRAPVTMVVDSIIGGVAGSTTFTNPVLSDVFGSPVLPDVGVASIHIIPKNPELTPSSTNTVTITGYRVSYVRDNGANVPGQDVPLPLNGVSTVTVPVGSAADVPFELVAINAKNTQPLTFYRSPNGGSFIALATVTFYGHDQAGNDVSVSGTIQIDFKDF